jgi:hypothetical protein
VHIESSYALRKFRENFVSLAALPLSQLSLPIGFHDKGEIEKRSTNRLMFLMGKERLRETSH